MSKRGFDLGVGDKFAALRMSEEQAAELRERLAEPNPETMTLAELDRRLRRVQASAQR